MGLEISKHCYMTRVCDGVVQHDLCTTPLTGIHFDLAFSIAFFEHIPEEFLPNVLALLSTRCKRGLHGIDFGERDDGFDKTHCSLHPKAWWVELFQKHDLHNHLIVDKEELEQGQFPIDVAQGDGKVKLNVGCFTNMHHYGWENIDILDQVGNWSLSQFAQANGYRFTRRDIREGLPHKTGEVDLIFSSHCLEHLTYREGLAFLRDCRRVLKPAGAMRILVPDAALLIEKYDELIGLPGTTALSDFDEISDGCQAAPTAAGKLWELLHSGHASAYDQETLFHILRESGFTPYGACFRGGNTEHSGTQQILRETTDMLPCLSLIVDAVPRTS